MADLVRKGVDSTVRGSLNASPAPIPAAYFTREPLLKEIPDGGFVRAAVSGTTYLYTRIGNARFRVALTAV